MANLGEWAQFLLAMMPIINLIVVLIEKLFGSSTGEEKKAKAMEAAKFILPSVFGDGSEWEERLSLAIDRQVELFNASGDFKHGVLTPGPDVPAY